MNLLKKVDKPDMALEAAEKQRGMHWALELLVFVAVFIVSSIAEAIIVAPGTMVLLFTNADYMNATARQDLTGAMEIANAILSSDVSIIVNLLATLMMIIVVFVFCRFIQKRPLRTLGFKKEGIVKEYVIGIVTGFLVFSAAVLLCVVTGALRLHGLSSTFSVGIFLLYVAGFMIQGMAEEVLCRGYFMVSMARRYPIVFAILANALLFALLHLLNSGITVLAFFNLVLFGVFASLYFLRRGSIWGIGAFHSVWNLVQGNFYGILVSGIETQSSVLRSEMVTGKEIWNGGAFGLEGGLGVTIVYLTGIFVLLVLKKKEAVSE